MSRARSRCRPAGVTRPDPLRRRGCGGGGGRQRSPVRCRRIPGLEGTRPAGRRGLIHRRAVGSGDPPRAGPGLPRGARGWRGGVTATRGFTCARPGGLQSRLRARSGSGGSFPSGSVGQPGSGPGLGRVQRPGVVRRGAEAAQGLAARWGPGLAERCPPGAGKAELVPSAPPALEAGVVVSGGPGSRPLWTRRVCSPPGGVPALFWVLPSTTLTSQAEACKGEGFLQQRNPHGGPNLCISAILEFPETGACCVKYKPKKTMNVFPCEWQRAVPAMKPHNVVSWERG